MFRSRHPRRLRCRSDQLASGLRSFLLSRALVPRAAGLCFPRRIYFRTREVRSSRDTAVRSCHLRVCQAEGHGQFSHPVHENHEDAYPSQSGQYRRAAGLFIPCCAWSESAVMAHRIARAHRRTIAEEHCLIQSATAVRLTSSDPQASQFVISGSCGETFPVHCS